MKAFFDSNILVYAFSTDFRRSRAIAILASGGIISAQVLNEFTNVLRNKQKQDWPAIEAAIGLIRAQLPQIAPLTADTHAAALAIARDHTIAFYDALIVAAALMAGCGTLYTEDMQHGRTISGLAIVNPFIESAQHE